MPPDRLAELRRQRALVAQHLAWIDAELTAAGSGQTAAKAVPPGPAPSETATAAEPPPPDAGAFLPATDEADASVILANARADEIIEKYRATEALDPAATKRGCLVLFGALFVLIGATVLAIYYFGYAR